MAISATERSSAVNIVIQASDRASDIFKSTGTQVAALGTSVGLLQTQMIGLSTVFTALGGSAIGRLAELNQAIGLLQRILNMPASQQLITSLGQQADEAVEKIASLSELMGGLSSVIKPALGGALGTESQGQLLNELMGTQTQIQQKTQSFSRSIAQTLLKDVKRIGEDWTNSFADQLPEVFGKRLAGKDLFGEALSPLLNFGVDRLIEAQLPAGVNQITGGALGGLVKGAALPPEIKQLLEGNVFDALETVIAGKIEDGLRTAYENADAITLGSQGDFEKAGGMIAEYVAEGFQFSTIVDDALTTAFEQVDLSNVPSPFKEVLEGALPGVQELLGGQLVQLEEPVQASLQALIKKAFSGESGALKPIREQLLQSLGKLDEGTDGLLGDIGSRLGARLGTAFGQGFLQKSLQGVGAAANKIDETIRNTVDFVEQIPSQLANPVGAVSQVFGGIAGFNEPLSVFQSIQGAVGGVTDKVFEVTQQMAFFSSGVQALQQFVVGGPFDMLIGQNVRLREQLLATQSSLVATNSVMGMDGSAIADPTQAIQALEGPINASIAKLREGSLELVGVTSNQLIESFQIIAGQSAQIGINLDQAADLTLSAAAAMGTLGLDMGQARQEITSILSGTIDMNSVLAKSLGITNQQVATWKSQGTIFENLTKRLEAFRAGNALSAKSVSGITSNIQEVFDEIGRKAGEPLLDPIVKRLDDFYQYLNQNLDAVADTVGNLVGQIFVAAEQAIDALAMLYNSTAELLGQVPQYLVKSLASAITEFANAIKTVIPIVQPAINVMAQLATQAYALGGPFLKIALQAFVLHKAVTFLSGGFGTLFQALPGVGEVLFLLTGRSNGLINTFATLAKQIGFGGAGFLMLGKHLNAIPALAGLVASRMGPLGGVFAGMIPQLAGIGIQFAGLTRVLPGLDQVFFNLTKQVPGLIGRFADLVATSDVAGGAFRNLAPAIQQVSSTVSVYANNIDNATFINTKFTEAAKLAGAMARQQLMSFGLLSAGVFAAFYIFDNFILKNKGLLLTLQAVAEGLKKLGGMIYNFMTDPFVVATGVIFGLGVAIRAGLLPAMMDMIKTFSVKAAASVTSWAAQATKSLRDFSQGIRDTSSEVASFFGNKQAAMKNDSSNFAAQLKSQAADFKQAIADRKAQLADLNGQKSKVDPVRNSAQFREIAEQQKAVQQEIDSIFAARKNQGAELANRKRELMQIQQQATSAVTPMQRLRGTFEQVGGAVTRLSGESIMQLGQSLEKVGFDRVGKQATGAGASIQEFGGSILRADTAQKGLLKSSELAALNLKNLQSLSVVAGKGISSAFAGIGKALGAMALEFGPVLLLTAAIATVTEAIGLYTKLTEASKNAVSNYSDAVAETSQKLSTLESQLKSTANSAAALNDSVSTYIEKRLDDLEKNASWLSKLADFSQNLNVFNAMQGDKGPTFVEEEAQSRLADEGKAFDVTMRQADEYRSKLQANWSQTVAEEQELANLRNKQAEANAAGNTAESKRLGEQIKLREDIIKTRKEDVDAQIAYLEKQNPVNARQKQDLAAQLQLLKSIRSELEEIPNTQITPPELPRLGTTMEQLGGKAQAALEFIAKGVGTSEQATQKAEELFEVTEAQVKLGQISSEEAARRYQQLANNANVSAEIQIKAQEAVASAREQANQRDAEAIDREKSIIEQAAADETMGEAAKQRQLLEIEGKGLEQRLEQLRADKAERDRLRAEELQSALALIDAQIGEAQSKLNAGNLSATDSDLLTKQIESLRADRSQTEAASNAAQAEDTRRTANSEQEILTQQATNAAELRQQEREQRLKDFEEAQTQLEGRRAQALMDDETYNQATLDITQARLDEELAIIEEQRQKLDPNDKEGLEALATREAAIYQQRRESRDRFFQEQRSAIQQDADEQLQLMEAQQSEGKMSQEEYAQASIDLTTARLDKELELVRQQRSQLAATDLEGQEKLAAAEAEILQQRRKAQDQFFDQLRQAASEDAQEQQTILEGEKAQGEMSRGEYAERSLALTEAQLDREQAIVEQERARISATDVEGQERLAAAEADIAKRRVQAQQDFYDRQLKIAEDARQKLLDAVKETETLTNIAIQEGLNSGAIRSRQANEQRLAAATQTAKDELAIEEQKLAELEAMPAFSDPDAEEDRQRNIRSSRQRTHDLTLSLAEKEYQRQQQVREALQSRLEDQLLQQQNEDQFKIMALEQQQRQIDLISRSYEQQNRLLDARKTLLQANQGLIDAELSALSSTTNSEAQRRDIARLTATIQLQTLDRRQQMERSITELNQRQQQLARDREMSENRIAQIRNQSATAKALADLATTEANPEATAAQIQAARGQVVASMMEGQSLREQGGTLRQQDAAARQLEAFELAAQRSDQQAARLNAQVNLIGTLNPRDRNRANRDLQQDLLSELGLGSMATLRTTSNQAANQMLDRGFGRSQMPVMLPAGLIPQAPSMALPPMPTLMPASTPRLAGAMESPQVLEALNGVNSMLQSLGTMQFTQTIENNNTFTAGDVASGRLGQQVEQIYNAQSYALARKIRQARR
jgi:hypothetical protein